MFEVCLIHNPSVPNMRIFARIPADALSHIPCVAKINICTRSIILIRSAASIRSVKRTHDLFKRSLPAVTQTTNRCKNITSTHTVNEIQTRTRIKKNREKSIVSNFDAGGGECDEIIFRKKILFFPEEHNRTTKKMPLPNFSLKRSIALCTCAICVHVCVCVRLINAQTNGDGNSMRDATQNQRMLYGFCSRRNDYTHSARKIKKNENSDAHTVCANNDERERAIETKDLFLRSQAKLKPTAEHKFSPEDPTESDFVCVESHLWPAEVGEAG